MKTSQVPKDLCDIVDASGRWMATSDIPELPISAGCSFGGARGQLLPQVAEPARG
jgi:hypothetical protein